MEIGKIVSSNSHIDYVCQIHGESEAIPVPQAQDYGFGTFVGIEQEGEGYLAGIIYDTQLLNPEFGNLGPRLSPREELAVFSPDYLAEKVTLVTLMILGSVAAEGKVQQGVPLIAPRLDARVHTLTQEEIVDFHRADTGLRLAYLPMLYAMAHPLALHLVLHLITLLGQLFPQEASRLAVLRSNVAWKSSVEPVG